MGMAIASLSKSGGKMKLKSVSNGYILRIAVGITVLALLLVGGAEAATEINSCTTISKPGEYVLNMSILDSSASSCINITSSDVTFDGAGYTIDGIDIVGTYGVYVYNSTTELINISVKNLKVTDWNRGIYYNRANGRISNNTADSNSFIGIDIEYSNNNLISTNNASGSPNGIFLSFSNYSMLSDNNASNNGGGIYLFYSSSNVLSSNNASNNNLGIMLDFHSNENTISNNIANSNNDTGIRLDSSSGSTIRNNTVSSNNYRGISFSISSNNLIYNNYFNNTNNAWSYEGNNTWNITKTAGTNIIGGSWLGGNFWAYPSGTGFSQTCADDDRNGICDSPSTLDSNNTDHLPLTYNISTSLDITKPSVTNVSVYPTTPEIDQEVNITADVSDEKLNTSNIFVEIKNPKGYTNTSSMIDSGNGTYYYNYKNTSEYGRYNVRIIAIDLAGNVNDTERTWFVTRSSQYSSVSIRGGGMAVKGYGPMVWNRTNFPGLVIKETLNVTNVLDRTIPESNFIYTTEAQAKMLKVVSEQYNDSGSDAAAAGLDRVGTGFTSNGEYYIIGWQGQPYVALNGKVDKLAKLVFEQGTSALEKKTLQVGETWDVGGGWTLTANSIDAKATPLQVWLTLSKDGVKKDDKVISAGTPGAKPVYTYTESIAGETDVPLFVTYVDSIFVGATSDVVQFRYTWAISDSATQIDSFKTYGLFNEAAIDNGLKILSLHNRNLPVNLPQNSTINLMGDLFFKATDNASLEYYPFFTSIPPTQVGAIGTADAAIEVITNSSEDGTIVLTKMTDTPPGMNRSFGLTQFGKYFEINASDNIKQNLTWIRLKLYYTKSELDASHLDENSLKISWYNESADPNRWEMLSTGSPEWVHGTGVEPADTSGYAGYVWANITHLSTFALVGNPAPTPTSPAGGGGSSGSSSGGGGGGGTSGENYSNIEIKEKYDLHIFKDKVTSYAFTNRSNPILFVNITGNINAGEISAVIETLRGTSTLVKSAAPGIVYKNANIWIGTSGFAVPKNIKEATIMFRVENSWLDSNNLARNEIKLVKWDGSKWIQLETSEKGRDNVYAYFEAKTDSFSPFAMTGIKAVPSSAPPETTATQPEPVETPGVTATATTGEPLQINLALILGSFVLVAIIVVLYLKRK
jgi:S-layer protein (TIGR01567 family)